MKIWQDKAAIESMKLGIFFWILFTAYLSFQNIVTHVYEEQGLSGVGPLNLIVNYLSFLISNTLAVKCKISFKAQMFIGSLAYTVNLSSGIFVPYIENHAVIYFIVAFGGLVGGISAGFLWVSQGGYLREACKHKENKGKYNAIFSFMNSLSFLTAGITTTFFLGLFDRDIYFKSLVSLGLLSSLYCVFFLKNISQTQSQSQQKKLYEPIHDDTNSQEQKKKIESILSQETLNEDKKVVEQISANVSKYQSEQKEQSVISNVINSLKFYKKMVYVLIFMIIDGLVLGIQSNQMTKLIPDEIKQNQDDYRLKTGILTIFIGAGSLAGSYLSGPLSDQFGLKTFGKITIFSYLLTCILTVTASLEKVFFVQKKMYWFACTMSFLWGFTYYFFEGWTFVSILKIFTGKLEAFAINKQVHCVSMAVFQVLVIVTKNQLEIKWLMLGSIVFIIPAIWSLQKIDYSQEKYGLKLKQTNDK